MAKAKYWNPIGGELPSFSNPSTPDLMGGTLPGWNGVIMKGPSPPPKSLGYNTNTVLRGEENYANNLRATLEGFSPEQLEAWMNAMTERLDKIKNNPRWKQWWELPGMWEKTYWSKIEGIMNEFQNESVGLQQPPRWGGYPVTQRY